MRIVVLYRPESEDAREIEEYLADFQRFHPGEVLDTFNIDSIEGSEIAHLYGIMEHPTILALKDDGQMQQMWTGIDKLPLMNDLAYYAQQ
jgi:hypothetical protein